MSVLYIRDKDGKFTAIPCMKGDDGKSAYEYAKEGGYTGTEEEFAEKLASEYSGGSSCEENFTGTYKNYIDSLIRKGVGQNGDEIFTPIYKGLLDSVFLDFEGNGRADATIDSLVAEGTINALGELSFPTVRDFSKIKCGINGAWVTLQDVLDDINSDIGDIDSALDGIVALQQSYIGGTV